MLDTLYTYGNAQYTYEVLNAIAGVIGSGYGSVVIQATAGIGLFYGVISSVISGRSIFATQGQFLGKYIIVTSLLLAPTTDLIVRDEVSGYHRNVEHVPFGLAFPAVVFNNLGYGLTKMFDTAFQVIDGDLTEYHKYGMTFGSNLVAESKHLKISDPMFYSNMYTFTKKCFYRTLAIAPEVYKHNNNLWEQMKTRGPKLLSTDYTYPINHPDSNKAGNRVILDCREAAIEMDRYWGDEAKYAVQRRLAPLLGAHNGDRERLGDSLDLYYSKYQQGFAKAVPGSGNMSALDLVRQQMVINVIKDVAVNYGKARAQVDQNNIWASMGEMAKEILPIFRGVCEVLVYSCFLLILLSVMLPGGWVGFVKYMQILLWLQLWGPLYSVLNFVMQISSQATSMSVGAAGFSCGTQSLLVSHHQTTAAIAGAFCMSIPVIAKWVVDYSGESFMQLAGGMMSSAGGVASGISQEITRGNTSLDNASIGNTQIGNSTMGQHNMSPNYEFGVNSMRMPDGSMYKTTGDGSQLTMSGAGLTHSVGANNLSLARGVSANAQRGLTDSKQQVDAWNKNLSSAEEAAQNKMAQHVQSFAERTAKGETFDFSTSGSEGQTIQNAMNYAKVLHDDYGYNKEQAAKMGVDISLKGGMSKVLGLVPGLNKIVDINPHASADISASNRQTLGERNENMSQENYHKNIESTLRAMSSDNFAKHNNLDNTFTEDMSDSYRQVRASHEALNHAEDRAKRYEDAVHWLENTSIHSDHNMYHTAQNWMVETGRAANLQEASRVLDDPFSEDYRKVGRDFAEEIINNDDLMRSARGLNDRTLELSNLEYAENNTFHDANFKINKDPVTSVKEYAVNKGLNVNDPNFANGDAIKHKVSEMNNKTVTDINLQKGRNEDKFSDKQAEVNEEEKGRKTRGVFGRDKKID